MKHSLLAPILAGGWLMMPMPLFAIDIDIPGVVKVCDTCGGGLLGGSRPNTPWSTVEFLQGVAQGSSDPLLSRAAQNLDQFKKTISDEAQKAIDNAVKAQSKATSDVAQNLIKSANDIVDATSAVARYGEREISGTMDVLSKAQQRVREGKVVDAMWHISTDSWQNTNKNAAQLAEENEIVAAAGQVAASAYGGPAGAAAYAAWLTYNKTGGNVDLALKAGVYAYVTASGSAVGDMPTDSVSQVAKKAALTGAVGGLAVAASGGSNEDALKAFVDSGSAVVVQSGQSYVSKNYYDTQPPRLDSYCVTAVDMPCADAKKWYDTTKKRVDDLKTLTSTSPTVTVTQDGDWAISWDKESITHPHDGTPAVALTYVGSGSPLNNTLREVAAIGDPSKFSGHWVAYRDVGASEAFFDFTDPGQNRSTPLVGDKLRANRNINMRFSPADWTAASGLLSSGTEVKVLEVRVLSAAGTQQEWIRLQLPTTTPSQAPQTLVQLIDAIKKTEDTAKKKELKLKARTLVSPNFAFAPNTFGDTSELYRYSETLSFVQYDPVSNILTVRRQRHGDQRSNTEDEWNSTEALDARAHIQIGRLGKLTSHEDGSFDVDCNDMGGKCVSYEVASEKCTEPKSSCESGNDWYVLFPAGDNPTATEQLRSALTTIIYKIDGRPAN